MEYVVFVDMQEEGDIRTVTSSTVKELTPIERIEEGFVFDEKDLPNPPRVVGKDAITKLNIVTRKFSYEYVDRPLTPDEEFQKVKEDLASTKAELANAQLDNLTALEALAQVYEELIALKLQVEGGTA